MNLSKAYDILGLPPGAPFAEVRAKYVKLARSCHPDKLVNVDPAERLEKEEYFKNVTVAYHFIESGGTGDETINWKDIFNSVVGSTEAWDILKTLYSKAKDAAARAEVKSRKTEPAPVHTVNVPVTLEDIQSNRRKKLRLFLRGREDPVFTTVMCGDVYPSTSITLDDNTELCINISPQEHRMFCVGCVNEFDLHTELKVGLHEYFTGTVRTICDVDGRDLHIDVLAFWDLEMPIVIENSGLLGRGNLYVRVSLEMPTKQEWNMQNSEFQENFLRMLNAVTSTVRKNENDIRISEQ